MKLKMGLVIFLGLFSFQFSFAEKIEFPEEELARETVLPKFETIEVVKNRKIVTDGRFELGAYAGLNTSEPIYNQGKVGLNLGYNWNEYSALSFNYAQWMSGLNTQYTDGLKEAPNYLDFNRAPKLKNSLYGHYEWKVFYGKMSLTKQSVIHLLTYPLFGLGMTSYEHKNYWGVDAGIGQKFFFSSSFALRADLKFQYSQAPSPFLQGKMRDFPDSVGTPDDPRPLPTEFQDRWGLNTILDLGVSFLF